MTARKGYGAVVAALLWVFGFDVVPMAHMVLHETLEEHEHGHRHQHDQDLGHEHEHGHGHGHEQAPSEHGEGSVAHRDLAANVPLPAVPEVLEALLCREASSLPDHDERPADRKPQTNRARAPPSVAA